MYVLNSWIYVDYASNVWKFSINRDKELLYTIMYKEGKWTKQKIIDKNVLGFYLYSDENGMHIIYSSSKAEMKYCTYIDQQWMGRTILKLDIKEAEIVDLKVALINGETHIFYVLIDKLSNDHGVLMHCKWNGKTNQNSKLQDIILGMDVKEYYSFYLGEDGILDLLFLTDEGNEFSLNHCSYINNSWTEPARLYGILGDNFEFKILKDQNGVHILNIFKESMFSYIDHVFIKNSGDIKKLNVYESKNKLTEIIMFVNDNRIYSCWVEENKIYYSYFNEAWWDSPVCLMEGNEHPIEKYNYCNAVKVGNNEEAYGIDNLNFELIIPRKLVSNDREEIDKENNINEKKEIIKTDPIQRENDYRKIKSELFRIKSEKDFLQQTVLNLNIQVEKKQKIQEEYEEKISRLLNHKKKADENYNIFMELQKKAQNDLGELNKRLGEETSNRKVIEEKYNKAREEKAIVKEQLGKLLAENDNLNKQFENEIKYREEIEGKYIQAEEEKIIVKEQLDNLLEENNKLKIQFEEETNYREDVEKKYIRAEEENIIIREQLSRLSEENDRLSKDLENEKSRFIKKRFWKI